MAPLRRQVEAAWEERVQRAARERWAVSWGEVAGWLQGQWTWAVVEQSGPEGKDPSLAALMVMELGDRVEQVRTQMTRLQERWVAAGRSVRSEQVRGVPVLVLSVPGGGWFETIVHALRARPEAGTGAGSADVSPSGGGGAGRDSFRLVLGVHRGALWLSDSPALLERVFSGLDGGPGVALGESQRVDPGEWAGLSDSMVFAWAALGRWLRAGGRASAPEGDGTEDVSAQLWRLAWAVGLSEVRSVTFRWVLGDAGSRWECVLRVPEQGRRRLLALLDFDDLDAMPPEWVPGDVTRFYRFRFSGRRAWSELEQALAGMGPVWQRVWTFLVETAQQAGRQRRDDFDLYRDVVDRLGNDWLYWQDGPRGSGWEAWEGATGIWLVGSGEAAQLARSVAEMLAGAALRPDAWEERDFLGRTVYSVPIPLAGPPGEPGGEVGRLHIAASERHVGFALDPAVLENWLRSLQGLGTDSLGSRPGWRAQVVGMGGGRGWVGYEDYAAMLRGLLAAVQSDPEHLGQARLPGPLGFRLQLQMAPEQWRPWLDPALLPPWEAWAPYVGGGWYAFEGDAEALRFRYVVTGGKGGGGRSGTLSGPQSVEGGR